MQRGWLARLPRRRCHLDRSPRMPAPSLPGQALRIQIGLPVPRKASFLRSTTFVVSIDLPDLSPRIVKVANGPEAASALFAEAVEYFLLELANLLEACHPVLQLSGELSCLPRNELRRALLPASINLLASTK